MDTHRAVELLSRVVCAAACVAVTLAGLSIFLRAI